ncbi:cytochrome-c oxidase, cbb3-type subunit II [Telmatospirillum siberiense]|uniref:Cytochrome-c oxidase, cbb3-type subunit II n=1 Tax=Telmatospirillum siberiense TaxID=382514 RepID=A0A2N3Q0N5_9PROT|nr:cytochrome-c oxidase, cbb3-type subunit II [Telmatospirillum siberiense]PKU26228.1 cytochrome-c oxidase, cbb3-type subunit II [Telmatospirillum siberiense]
MSILKHHAKIETNVILLMVGILLTVIIGGIVEIVPLFTITETIEKVEGMRPYSPLEQEGRNIYVREGCYLCHSQMIRPFRDEAERYGHYSLAAESMYDHPFQWGSKRNGPDLARVGGKYSNDWHVRHLDNPRDVVPESIMPGYRHLHRPLNYDDVVANMKTLRVVGVPYTEDDIANAKADLVAQATTDASTDALLQRYPKASVGKKDRTSDQITEMDALVAYLQMLGTLVDFSTQTPDAIR